MNSRCTFECKTKVRTIIQPWGLSACKNEFPPLRIVPSTSQSLHTSISCNCSFGNTVCLGCELDLELLSQTCSVGLACNKWEFVWARIREMFVLLYSYSLLTVSAIIYSYEDILRVWPMLQMSKMCSASFSEIVCFSISSCFCVGLPHILNNRSFSFSACLVHFHPSDWWSIAHYVTS